jgi:hypothetical protein
MPNSLVQSYAEKSGKSVAAVEEMWDEIKKYVNKKYPKLAKARKFAYITFVLGKKLGIKKTKKIKESSNMLKLGELLVEATQNSKLNLASIIYVELDLSNLDDLPLDKFIKEVIDGGKEYNVEVTITNEISPATHNPLFKITGTIKNIIDFYKKMGYINNDDNDILEFMLDIDDLNKEEYKEIKDYFNKS